MSATEILTRKPQNIAIKTNPKHELNIVDVETPEPGPDDCLVHVRATGICGSDVHFWKDGCIGESIIKHDLGLGHESAGIVVKTGSNVKKLKVGMSPPFHCR
jgi:L-iditol 2-dehydrogenase